MEMADANITLDSRLPDYTDAGISKPTGMIQWMETEPPMPTAPWIKTHRAHILLPTHLSIPVGFLQISQLTVRLMWSIPRTPPVITIIGDANLTHLASTTFIDQGANWTDLVDGNGTADANGTVDQNTPGTYQIIYSVTDSSGCRHNRLPELFMWSIHLLIIAHPSNQGEI